MTEEKILRIGVASRDYVKRRTIEIASGTKPLLEGEPKLWVSSIDSLAKVLSSDNMLLLEMIRNSRPQSLTELAEISGRAKSNLSRTLHSMEGLGIIEFQHLPGGRKAPIVMYDKVKFEYELRPTPQIAA